MEHRTEEGVPLLRLRCTMSVFVILSAVIAYRPIRIKETDYRYRDKNFGINRHWSLNLLLNWPKIQIRKFEKD